VAARAPGTATQTRTEDQQVVVSLIKRNKRKFVTNISGLDTFPELRMKDVAKALGRRFATGSSVSTNAVGRKEIIVQGDVLIDIERVLNSNFSVCVRLEAFQIYFISSSHPKS